jgi:hypothetical protein
MPIGADSSLAPRTGGKRSPLAMPNLRPPMIADSAVQSQANNAFAAGAGAGRSSLMATDRAGISRGRGQKYRADMASANSMAQSTNAANQITQDAGNANASARLAYDNAMRGEQMQYAGLLEGLRSTSAMNQLARRGFGQDASEARARGKFGLDSIYLDKTPLLGALFS